jgi:hypothetical protein
MKKLNRVHFDAIEILKKIERKFAVRSDFELKEAESCVNESLSNDLGFLISIRTLWWLNEEDRSTMLLESKDDMTTKQRRNFVILSGARYLNEER